MTQPSNTQRIIRVLLSIVLTLSLLVFSLSVSVSLIFSTGGISSRLHKNGFYDFAGLTVEENIESLQSVIGVDTAAVMDVLAHEGADAMLESYTDALNALFLTGGQAPDRISYDSDALYQLICGVITEDVYDGDIAQMEQDRADAYAELTKIISDTLSFFPQSLLKKLTGGTLQARLARVYSLVRVIRVLWLPALLLFLACAAGLFFLRRHDPLSALRGIAGVWFVTGSLLFLPALFIRTYSLPNRLSLADGLLRRYILTVYTQWTSSLFTVMLLVFAAGAVFLTVTIILTAKSGQTSCTAVQNVLE